MSAYCPFCSAEMPEGSQFCPSCQQYLGWEEKPAVAEPVRPQRGDTGARPRPSGSGVKQRGATSTSSHGRPALACPHTTLRVVPGESADCPLVVATTGERVDDIRLHLAGPAAAFGAVEPEVLHLYPEATADAVIRFAAPRGCDVEAGVHPWTLVATSVTHDGATATIDGTTQVEPYALGGCQLHPAQTAGRGTSASYALLLDNDGNVPWNVIVRPEPATGLRFDTAELAWRVAPGAHDEVPVRIRSKRVWFGSPRVRSFDLHVEPTSQPAPDRVTLTGTRQQLPFLPLWVVPILLVLVGLGLAAVALFGGNAVAVPAVAGQPSDVAVTELRDAGFRVTEISVSDAQVPSGQAVRTDPISGTEVPSGSAVTLYVSAGPPKKRVEVPAVANLPVADAREQLESVELDSRVERLAHDTVAIDSVIRSDPNAGVEVERGYTVVLYVSTGPAPTTNGDEGTGNAGTGGDEGAEVPVYVPGVGGMTQQQAQDELADAGLQLGQVTTEPSDDVAEGMVIRTEPEQGAQLDRDATIGLVVSSGPEMTVVPEVVGMGQESAEDELAAAGLNPGRVESRPSEEAPSGEVISTSPEPGADIVVGGEVDMVVSSGPPVGTRVAEFTAQPSYTGDCRLRDPGTVCAGFDDDYVWLIQDSIRGWRYDDVDGQPVQVAIGAVAEYQHVLDTDQVRTVPVGS